MMRAPRSTPLILATATIVVILFGLTLLASPASAFQPNVLPDITLVEIAPGLSEPVYATHAGDGSGRLFILEQRGVIRIYQNGLLPQPFLDINGRVRSSEDGGGSEEGLLGMAFPPGYGTDREHFYIYYTNLDGNNQVSRFSLGSGPNQADSGSEQEILLLLHPGQSNHNGGMITFGPGGYLYVGPGDGGGGGDPENNAQDLGSLLGKILRIDTELRGAPTPGLNQSLYMPIGYNQGGSAPAYRIPEDNPFAGTPGFHGEIWALGLRNPWRFSFDRQNDDLLIADVGQNTWEEVNYQPGSSSGGENYGWDMYEATQCYTAPCDPGGKTMPFFFYSHQDGGCSVTGGYVYRGNDYPNLEGIYFFADYCSGRVWGSTKSGNSWTTEEIVIANNPALDLEVSSFGEDEAGEIYLLDRNGGGTVYQVTSP